MSQNKKKDLNKMFNAKVYMTAENSGHGCKLSDEEIEMLKADKSPAYPLGRYTRCPDFLPEEA